MIYIERLVKRHAFHTVDKGVTEFSFHWSLLAKSINSVVSIGDSTVLFQLGLECESCRELNLFS